MSAKHLAAAAAILVSACQTPTISPVGERGDGGYVVVGSHEPHSDAAREEFARRLGATADEWCAARGKQAKLKSLKTPFWNSSRTTTTLEFDCQ